VAGSCETGAEALNEDIFHVLSARELEGKKTEMDPIF
jgi:hypothetical protein